MKLNIILSIAFKRINALFIAALFVMAHALGLQVIAEGVENEQQLAYLALHGCTRFQGFYFSKPLPAIEIEKRW